MSLALRQAEKVKNYVNGAWVDSPSGQEEQVFNPATGEVIAYVPLSGREETDTAVRAAAVAYTSWKKVAVPRRARYFFHYQQLLMQHRDELAGLITLENGKSKRKRWARYSAALNVWNSPRELPR